MMLGEVLDEDACVVGSMIAANVDLKNLTYVFDMSSYGVGFNKA